MSAIEPLADRRRRLVRGEIARIAMRLFAERGFDAVTVDDVAAAAGISPRTFFRYFATKDEVVLDFEARLRERLRGALVSRPDEEGPVTALRNAYLVTAHVEREERARVVQLGRVLATAPALRTAAFGALAGPDEALIAVIAGRMGVGPSDRRARAVVVAMGAVATAEWAAWVADARGDPAVRIGEALAFVEHGLSTLDRPVRNRKAARP
jgi:AcrR family transcriptional regulator